MLSRFACSHLHVPADLGIPQLLSTCVARALLGLFGLSNFELKLLLFLCATVEPSVGPGCGARVEIRRDPGRLPFGRQRSGAAS